MPGPDPQVDPDDELDGCAVDFHADPDDDLTASLRPLFPAGAAGLLDTELEAKAAEWRELAQEAPGAP